MQSLLWPTFTKGEYFYTKNPGAEMGTGVGKKIYWGLVGLLLSVPCLYFLFIAAAPNVRLVPLVVIALICGLVFESIRASGKWMRVMLTWLAIITSCILLVFNFLPFASPFVYSIIPGWPALFAITMLVFALVFYIHITGAPAELTEGITLLQSIAIIYWAADHDIFISGSILLRVIVAAGLLFSLFSFFHAFSKAPLLARSRFILSVWSCVVMLLFAADNIYGIYESYEAENAAAFDSKINQAVTYFLLGVSLIYILQNLLLLLRFAPGKGSFFNDAYKRRVAELRNDHVNRFSTMQVNTLYSFFCVVFSGSVFWLNYEYRLVPANTAIWIVFFIFPYILILWNTLIYKRSEGPMGAGQG